MSNLSNPVSAYLQLSETSTKIYRGQSYQIKYSTISDAKPVFTSTDEKIALVDKNTGVITGANKGTTTIKVELPATENYNAASAEFTVEVDALLNLPATEKEIGIGGTYDIGVTTESDGAITYKSSDEKVATVDATGKVTAVACGDAKITVSIAATPKFDRTETTEFTAKVRIQNLAQLAAAIAASKEVTALLGEGVSITLPDAGIDLSGKKVTIKGDEKKPATVKVKNEIIISDDFVLENVVVDASESTKPFISLAATPTTTAVNDCYFIDNVIIKNTAIKDMQSYFIYSSSQTRYVVKNMMIDGCVVKLKTILDGTSQLAALIRLNNNQSGVKDFTVQNSTFYQTGVSNPQYFVQYSQGDPGRWKLADAETWSFNYYNNTFYGVTTGNWANTPRTNNVKGRTIFNLKKNIWVDCGNGQTVQRILNQQQASGFKEANFEYNTYWKDGAAVDQSSYDKSGKILTTDPKFKDAANGDFTPQGDKQVENKTGDPRWLK